MQSQDNGGLEGQDSFDTVDKNGRSRNREKDNGRQNSLMPPAENNPSSSVTQNNFYFYNPATVAFGKKEFKKNWGDRAFKENWRLSSAKADAENSEGNDTTKNDSSENSIEEKVDERHTVDFYLKQLPKNQIAIDSIAKERNFAYYQLGSIYKEKFKKYSLAENKYAKLLELHPEERLVLPSMYNLYKIYQILGDKDKELAMKDRIINQYPDSRYAQIIGNTNSTSVVSRR
jgi:tetratricopeptide (TPR) repeat protein